MKWINTCFFVRTFFVREYYTSLMVKFSLLELQFIDVGSGLDKNFDLRPIMLLYYIKRKGVAKGMYIKEMHYFHTLFSFCQHLIMLLYLMVNKKRLIFHLQEYKGYGYIFISKYD